MNQSTATSHQEIPKTRPIRVGPHGDKLIWSPQPGSQEAFLSCPAFEALYHGTRGPGKSDALIMAFAQYVGAGFGAAWRGVIFRQTYKQLQDLVTKSRKWFALIWPEAKFNSSTYVWKWPSGEELLFRQFQREDDYWNYHGHEYPFVGWDELTTWPDLGGYKRMISCCRSSDPGMPRMVRATTNPYGPGHNAVKHYFGLPGLDGVPVARRYTFEDPDTNQPIEQTLHRVTIKGTIYENKILLRAQPGYIEQLKKSARNEAELAAWLEGSWDIVAGGMFDDVFDPRYNIVPWFIVPRSWKIDRSFDWGSAKPFSVGWWAESDGTDLVFPDGTIMATVAGDIFRIAEWYGWTGQPNEGRRMLAKDIARGIVERELMMGIYERVRSGVADTSIFDVENGVCIAQDMSLPVRVEGKTYEGVSWLRADKSPGSRITGWEQMRQYLRNAHPPDYGPREYPGLFIVDHCEQWRRTVPVLPRDEKNMDDVDTQAEDHIADESRYRVRYSGMRARSTRTSGMY